MINDFLLLNGYFALVIILLVEGQPVLILVGFLIAAGFFNWWLAFLLGVFAMFVGDWLWWKIGFSYGYSFVEKYGRYFFLRKEKLARLTVYVKDNNNGVLFRSKFVYGTGHIMLLLWGVAKQSFKNFWQLNLLGNILSYLIFTTLGYYFGKSLQAWNWYFKIAAVVLFILILWSTHWFKKVSFFRVKSN